MPQIGPPSPSTQSGVNDWRRWLPSAPNGSGRHDGTSPDSFAAGLAELVGTLQQEGLSDDLHALTVITQGAVGMIRGAEQAVVVVPGRTVLLEELAAYGPVPPLLLKAQNVVGEGPCVDAVLQPMQILSTDLATEQRWPQFTRQAAQWRIRSVLCTPMLLDGNTVGSLTLFSTAPHAFDQEAANLAAVFAAHATLALTSLRQIRSLERKADSRGLIGQAQGMLMQRHQISADQAFGLLVRASQHSNIKLHELCKLFTATGRLPAGLSARSLLDPHTT